MMVGTGRPHAQSPSSFTPTARNSP